MHRVVECPICKNTKFYIDKDACVFWCTNSECYTKIILDMKKNITKYKKFYPIEKIHSWVVVKK